jgi:transcriptional regulator with XRE-family HTH domain
MSKARITGFARFLEREKLRNAEFAERAGVSEAAVSRYARGEQFPRLTHLRKMQAASGGNLTADDFLADDFLADEPAPVEASA